MFSVHAEVIILSTVSGKCTFYECSFPSVTRDMQVKGLERERAPAKQGELLMAECFT